MKLTALRQHAPACKTAIASPRVFCATMRGTLVVRCSAAPQSRTPEHHSTIVPRAVAAPDAPPKAPAATKAAAVSQPKLVFAELDVPKGAPGRKLMVAQIAPAVRVAMSEAFGLPPGATTAGQVAEALRKLGFDFVFDTMFSADLTIMEEASELLHRLTDHLQAHPHDDEPLPMFTSCCPGWIGMMEKSYPELIPYVSSCKSPQMMMGAVVKSYFAKQQGVKPSDISMVSVMPCVRKQEEADREWARGRDPEVHDVDHVITTAELAAMLKERNIAFTELPDGPFDKMLAEGSGGGVLFGTTGGVMEAALRTAYEFATGKKMERLSLAEVRGMEGIKEAQIDLVPAPGTPLAKLLEARAAQTAAAGAPAKGPVQWDGGKAADGPEPGLKLRVAVANGLGSAKKLLTKMQAGESKYDFVEIMACPAGCVGGGGQPRSADKQITQKRQAALYTLDERSAIRRSHENPEIQALYKDFLGEPCGHTAHDLLHTHYLPGGSEAAE